MLTASEAATVGAVTSVLEMGEFKRKQTTEKTFYVHKMDEPIIKLCNNVTQHKLIYSTNLLIGRLIDSLLYYYYYYYYSNRHENIRKEMKITNCNRLAGSERALE